MRMNKFLLAGYCLLSLLSACRFNSSKQNNQEETFPVVSKMEILNADREFSAMSEAQGLRNAYAEFIDSNGVILRPGYIPLVGGDAIDFITQSNDTSFTMTWEPKNAQMAASGDMGFTYGIYSLKPKETDTVYYGSYVTVWKKQPGGKWKFVAHSGNEGLDQTTEEKQQP